MKMLDSTTDYLNVVMELGRLILRNGDNTETLLDLLTNAARYNLCISRLPHGLIVAMSMPNNKEITLDQILKEEDTTLIDSFCSLTNLRNQLLSDTEKLKLLVLDSSITTGNYKIEKERITDEFWTMGKSLAKTIVGLIELLTCITRVSVAFDSSIKSLTESKLDNSTITTAPEDDENDLPF